MKNIIVVCKRGHKRTRMYTVEHVNIMKNMLDRHGTEYDNFVCITDQKDTMPSNIEVFEIPDIPQHKGWWAKIETFNPKLPVTGDNLYIDLDCVVVDNLDCLWEYQPGGPCKIINCSKYYADTVGWQYNSSVYRYKISDFDFIWWDYRTKWEHIQRNYFFGDEKYTSDMDKKSKMYPEEWIYNYEHVILQGGRHHMTSIKTEITDSVLPENSKIVWFGGGHKPWRCKDNTIKEHYQ